jgi:catechol 2,3-dioxygenase-like lactoylglutathione lyase family enzyme
MQFIKVIPLMKSIDMDQSLDFYTRILDFEKDGRWPSTGFTFFQPDTQR